MAENKTQLERNAFVKGFITEASPLTFPDNASIDEANFVLNEDGSRQRRLGLDYEAGGTLINLGLDETKAVPRSVGIWHNAGDDADKDLAIFQVGNVFHFYDRTIEPLSAGFITNINIGSLPSSDDSAAQYAAINGQLIVAYLGILTVLELNGNSVNIIKTVVPTVRDLKGVDDGLAPNERPPSTSPLTPEHHYNLYNQGWNGSQITAFEVLYNAWPSNSDIASVGVKDDGTFDASLIQPHHLGNSLAPRGKYILSTFGIDRTIDRNDRTAADGMTPNPLLGTSIDHGYIDTVAPFAGRIFYSGAVTDLKSTGDDMTPNYTGTIFFTPILSIEADYDTCHQAADPTSQDIFELVATDGGTVRIAEAGKILKMIQVRESLLIISTNGAWELSGPDGIFRADDYSIRKLTSDGAYSALSVVQANDVTFYWSKVGIIAVSYDDRARALVTTNITSDTIQTFYDEEIPSIYKQNAVGGTDSEGKTVRWIYNGTPIIGHNYFPHDYNNELVFNIKLQAFYKHSFSTTDGNVPVGYINTDLPDEINKIKFAVTTITSNSGGLNNWETGFAEYNNTDFEDFGVDAAAFMLTGWEAFDETQREKQLPYLTTHFMRTESGFTDDGGGNLSAINPSSCLISTQWDFADHTNSGKWTSSWQAYRLLRMYIPVDVNDPFDYGHQVITTKNRIRGSGRVFSFLMETEPLHDCHILGWAMKVVGRSNV